MSDLGLFAQELKSAVDIVDLISEYTHLKRANRTFVGLCPFHSEKTPSFTVYPQAQSFYCYGCGVGGDVVSFVRNIENMSFMEAIQFLAQRAGLELPESDQSSIKRRTRIYEINRRLARFYHDCLKQPSGKPGLDYLKKRGLTSKTIVRFGIGWAPEGWDKAWRYMRSLGYGDDELLDACVITKTKRDSYIDMFRARVMFPIIDTRANVIGFGGRGIAPEQIPKYINTSDTPVFKKSRNLFAFQLAKSSPRRDILVCEGYMDVISMHQAGFDNAVASLGTALTPEQTRLISQYTHEVVLAYDSDAAGQKATQKAIELFNQCDVRPRVLKISGAKDPDEYVQKFGAERFAIMLDKAQGAVDYHLGRLAQKYDTQTPEGKIAYLDEFISLMATIPNRIERDVYVSRAAIELEVDKQAIQSQLAGKLRYIKKKQQLRHAVPTLDETSSISRQRDYERIQHIRYALAEDKLLAILIMNEDFYPHIRERIGADDFVTQRNRALAQIIFERMERGEPVSISALNEQCTVEQISFLTGYIAAIEGMRFECGDADDYINTILEFGRQKSKEQIASMQDAEWQAYIASLAAGKK